MRSILLIGARAALLAAMAWSAGGCATSAPLVANPNYQMWADFEPGSWARQEGTRRTNDQTEQIEITQRLVERTADRVIIERTVKVKSAATSQPAPQPIVTRLAEPKMIKATENLQTRPDARVKQLAPETVTVKGLALACRVLDVELHVAYDGLLPTCEDSHLRRWISPAAPGGTVRLELDRMSTTHYLQVSIHLVDYKVVRRDQP